MITSEHNDSMVLIIMHLAAHSDRFTDKSLLMIACVLKDTLVFVAAIVWPKWQAPVAATMKSQTG